MQECTVAQKDLHLKRLERRVVETDRVGVRQHDYIKADREGWKWAWPFSIPSSFIWPISATAFTHTVNPSHPLRLQVCVSVSEYISKLQPLLHSLLTPLSISSEKKLIMLFPLCVCMKACTLSKGFEQDRHIYKWSVSTLVFLSFRCDLKLTEKTCETSPLLPSLCIILFPMFCISVEWCCNLHETKAKTHPHTWWFRLTSYVYLITK